VTKLIDEHLCVTGPEEALNKFEEVLAVSGRLGSITVELRLEGLPAKSKRIHWERSPNKLELFLQSGDFPFLRYLPAISREFPLLLFVGNASTIQADQQYVGAYQDGNELLLFECPATGRSPSDCLRGLGQAYCLSDVHAAISSDRLYPGDMDVVLASVARLVVAK
jgi:hypothetical protein